jgi:hypothetical protein
MVVHMHLDTPAAYHSLITMREWAHHAGCALAQQQQLAVRD